MRAGSPSFWDHRGPRRMGTGASSVLGPPRPPPRGCGGLLRFGTGEPTATWARGPPSPLRPTRPLPHGRGVLLNLGTKEAPTSCAQGLLGVGTNETATAWAPGPPPFSDH